MYVSCRASQMWYLDQAPTQFGARAAGKKRTLEPDADMGLDDLETPAAKRITNSVFAEETAFGGPDFSRWHPGRRDSWSTEPPTPPPLDFASSNPTPPPPDCAMSTCGGGVSRVPTAEAVPTASNVEMAPAANGDAVDALISARPQPCAMAPGWVSASMAQVLVVAPPSAQAPGGGVQAAPAFTNGGYLYSGLTGKLLVHCGTAWGEAVYQEFDGCGDEVMGA